MKKLLITLTLLISQTSFAYICGKSDSRTLSHEPQVGRFVTSGEHKGCVITLISRNCAITAGTCLSNREIAEFNTPLSVARIPMGSKPEDQYRLDPSFAISSATKKIGDEWAVVRLARNEITGKYPGDVQGYLKVASQKSKKKEKIRVVGYGGVIREFPTDDADIRQHAQQVSYGTINRTGLFLLPSILRFVSDTSYGDLGAPVINEQNEVVGLSTHNGCELEDANAGTYIQGSRKFKKAIAQCLKDRILE